MSDKNTDNALISLSRRFVEAFVSGEKCVELRRRRPDIPVGANVWFYSKVPDGKIRAFGIVRSIDQLRRDEIWSEFGNCLSITENEFDEYLGSLKRAFVIRFREIREIQEPISLQQLRDCVPNFQPPQFFTFIRADALLERLNACAENSARIAHPG